MPDDLGPNPQTGLMPPRYPPSPGPDFEAIYEYAKQWLDLGDEIYLYYVNLAIPALGITWSGGAQAKAMESLEPLRRLLVDPTQDPSGQSFLSAARMVWNIGESINWYADKLQEERKKEDAQALKDMFLGIFMFALIFVAFVPALGFIANLMATFTRLLTAVVRIFEGAVWMERMAGFVGGAIDGALGAFVSDKVFGGIAGGIAGTHLKDDPKNTIINVAVGAGVGGLFGLGAVGRNAPHDVPGGIGPKGAFGNGANGPKNVGSGGIKSPDVGDATPNVKFPGDKVFSGPKLEGHGPLTVKGDGDSIVLDTAPPYSVGTPETVRPGSGRLGLEPPPNYSVKPNDSGAGRAAPVDAPRTGAPRPEGGGTPGGPTRDVGMMPPRDGPQLAPGVPRNGAEPPPSSRDLGSSDPRFPGAGRTLGGDSGPGAPRPGPNAPEVPPVGPHEPISAGPGGPKAPDAGNALSAKPDGARLPGDRFPGTGNTLGGKPGIGTGHPEPNVYEGPLPRPHESPHAAPSGPRPPDAGNVLGAQPATSDLRPVPNTGSKAADIAPAGPTVRDVPPGGPNVRDAASAGPTGPRPAGAGGKAGSSAPVDPPTTPRDSPAPPARDVGDRQPSATSTGDGNAVSARSGSGDRPGVGQAGKDDRRGTGGRDTGDGPVLLPGHGGPPPGAGREVIRIDPETGARDLVTVAKDPFPGTGRTLDAAPRTDRYPTPNVPEGPSPRPAQGQSRGAGGGGHHEFHEVDPVTGKTTPTTLGPNDLVVSAKPVDRQVFRTNVDTGQRELVTLSRLPGRGNTLGAAPGEPHGTPRSAEGPAPRPRYGPDADGGSYRYHEIDPHTGAATPTEVGPAERVARVQPASGFEQRDFVLKGGERVPVGAPDERVLRYDWGKRQWDVDTVPRGTAPTDGKAYHVDAPPGRALKEPVPEPAGFQVLRRDADGNVDLLTYQRDPVRVANGKTDGFTFQELGTGRTGWHEGEFLGSPKVERVTTVADANRLDGTPVKTTATGVLVRDPETGLWTPVRGGGSDVPAAVAPKTGGPSYYRAAPGRDGLEPAGVKGDPLPVVKVRSDGTVQTTTFSPSGDDLPRLRVGENGELLNATPDTIRPDQLSFDPKSGSLTFREFKPYESPGGSGGGSGGGPDGPSGGGPSRGGGSGGGLGQRGTGAGSQTRTETRTITFTEDKPPQVSGKTRDGNPEEGITGPKPTDADAVATRPGEGGPGSGQPDPNVRARPGEPSQVESPGTPTRPGLPPGRARTDPADAGAAPGHVVSAGRGPDGAPLYRAEGPNGESLVVRGEAPVLRLGREPKPVSSPAEGGTAGVAGGRPSREQLAAAAQQRMDAGVTPVDDSALVTPEPKPVSSPAEGGTAGVAGARPAGVRPRDTGAPVREPGRQVFRVDPVTGERDLVTLTAPREPFPGGGDTIGAEPGTALHPAPRNVGTAPSDGPSASRGATGRGGHEYYEVDPRTGTEIPTSVQPDESVLRVQPVGGTERGAGGRVPAGDPAERVAVFDPRTGRWDVTTVGSQAPPSATEPRAYHVAVPRDRTLTAPAPESRPAFQVLRGDANGNVDLLTFDGPPARVPEPMPGPAPAQRYFELEAGRWYEGRYDTAPTSVERVTTVGPTAYRLDGRAVETDPSQNRALVRDPGTGRWSLVRNDPARDAAPVEPVESAPAGGPTYFRTGQNGAGLSPIEVRTDPLRVVRVGADGRVSLTTFSPSGGDGLPRLRLDADGALVGETPDRISSDQLAYDPRSGQLTLRQPDGSAAPGSGAAPGGTGGTGGGGPARGGSGGGPARAGGGLGQRPAGTGSQTQTETPTRTITFTEDKPPLTGGPVEGDLPEPALRQSDPPESGTIEQPGNVEYGDGPEVSDGPEVAAGGHGSPDAARPGGTGGSPTSVTTPTPTSTQPPPVVPPEARPATGNILPLAARPAVLSPAGRAPDGAPLYRVDGLGDGSSVVRGERPVLRLEPLPEGVYPVGQWVDRSMLYRVHGADGGSALVRGGGPPVLWLRPVLALVPVGQRPDGTPLFNLVGPDGSPVPLRDVLRLRGGDMRQVTDEAKTPGPALDWHAARGPLLPRAEVIDRALAKLAEQRYEHLLEQARDLYPERPASSTRIELPGLRNTVYALDRYGPDEAARVAHWYDTGETPAGVRPRRLGAQTNDVVTTPEPEASGPSEPPEGGNTRAVTGPDSVPAPAAPSAGSSSSEPVAPHESGPLPDDADTRMLRKLGTRITDGVTSSGGGDLMADLFDARFPAGARLRDGAGDGQGTAWRADSAADGPGWRPVVSWHDVAAAARQAGRSGFTLVRLDDASPDAVGLHVGRDAETLWIVHLRPGVAPVYHLFDESRTAGLPGPVRAAVINYCADVQSVL